MANRPALSGPALAAHTVPLKTARAWLARFQPTWMLALFAVLSSALYARGLVRPLNLLERYDQPRLDLTYLYNLSPEGRAKMVWIFLALALFYAAGWYVARYARGRLAWSIVILGSLLMGAVLLLLSPFDAADIYDNILHGRILGVYHANPFRALIARFPRDPFFRYAAWKGAPSAYGPGWELLAGLVAARVGDGILANTLAFKILPGFFLLGSIAIVALISRRENPERALANTLLLAWNPVVLYETWGNGHNDMVMVFWVLAAVWALRSRRFTLAVLALVAGALVKFIPFLLLPAALLVAHHTLKHPRQRWRFWLTSLLAAALVIALAYLPFLAEGSWPKIHSDGPQWSQLVHYMGSVFEKFGQVLSVKRRAQLFSATLPAFVYHWLTPELGKEKAAALVSSLALGLTLSFTLTCSFAAARKPFVTRTSSATRSPDTSRNPHATGAFSTPRPAERFLNISYQIIAFYLLFTCLWFQQWYTLWLVGLAPLLSDRRWRRLAVIFAFWALCKQFIFGPYLLWPEPRFPQPWLEFWFFASLFALPWMFGLYALWHSWRKSTPGSRRLVEDLLPRPLPQFLTSTNDVNSRLEAIRQTHGKRFNRSR